MNRYPGKRLAIDSINGQPLADVREIKHARWRGRYFFSPQTKMHDIEMGVCSNCGYECSFDADTGIGYMDYNYCPNCGAKMDLEEQNG